MKKKIAMIDPSLFTRPYDTALIDGLIANGHEVVLYTKYLTSKETNESPEYLAQHFYNGLQAKWIASLPSALYLALKGLSHFFSLISLFFVLKKSRPDVIHFQWLPLPIIDAWFIALYKTVAPVVLTVHDSSPFNNNPKIKLQAIGAIRIMRSFDFLIVHTDNAREALVRHGVDAAHIFRVEHGLLSSFPNTFMTEGVVNLNREPVVILLFGHLKPYKGADLLIEAFSKMTEDLQSRACLHIVGKSQMDVTELFAKSKALGVEKNLKWDLRFIPDLEVEGIFLRSDIVVMPYREIDASGVLMVSLALGRPIVASNIGLFAELLESGKHGFLISVGDVDALAVALSELIDDPMLRSRMGANVKELGDSIPTWAQIARSTDQVYDRALKLTSFAVS